MFAPPRRATPPSILARRRPSLMSRVNKGGKGGEKGKRVVGKKGGIKRKEDWVYPDMSPGTEDAESPRRVVHQYLTSGHHGEPTSMLEWCAIQSGIYSSARSPSPARSPSQPRTPSMPSIPAISYEASVARGVARSPKYSQKVLPQERVEEPEPVYESEPAESESDPLTPTLTENSKTSSTISPVLGWNSTPVAPPQGNGMQVVTPNTTKTKWMIPEEGEEWRDTLPVVSVTPSICPSNFSPQRNNFKLDVKEDSPATQSSMAAVSTPSLLSVPTGVGLDNCDDDPNPSTTSPITPISASTTATRDTGTDPISPSCVKAKTQSFAPVLVPPPIPTPTHSVSPPLPYTTYQSSPPAAFGSVTPPCGRCGSSNREAPRVSPLPPATPQPLRYDSSYLSPDRALPERISPDRSSPDRRSPGEDFLSVGSLFHSNVKGSDPAWEYYSNSEDGDMELVSFSSDNDEPYATKDFATQHAHYNETPNSFYKTSPQQNGGPSLAQLLLSDEAGHSPVREAKGRSPLLLKNGRKNKGKHKKHPALGVRGRQKAFALKEKEVKVRGELELEQSTERLKLSTMYKNETSMVCGPKRLVDVLRSQCESSKEVMHTLITMGNMKGLEYLLEKGEETINSVLPDGSTPLITAVKCNRLEMTKQIIGISAEIDSDYDLNGWSAMHHAASRTSPSLLSVLLGVLAPQQRRVAVNKTDKDGATPLHVLLRTAEHGIDVRECVTLLLSSGADLTLSSFNESCAQMMLRSDLVDIVASVSHQILPHLKRLQQEGKGDRKLLAKLINSTTSTSSSVIRIVVSVPFPEFDQKDFIQTVIQHNQQLTPDNILILSIFREGTHTVLRLQISGIIDSESILFSIVRRCRSPEDPMARRLSLIEVVLESEEVKGALPWSPLSTPIDMKPKELSIKPGTENADFYLEEEPQEDIEDEVSSRSVAEEVVSRFDKSGSGCLTLEEWNAMLCELGSVSISEDDFEAMCRSRRINPTVGLDPSALSDLMTSSIEESLRELLCIPKIAEKVIVSKMRVRHILNGKHGVVVGYRREGVVLVDFVDFKGTPIGLRNLSWEGKRSWLTSPDYTIIEEITKLKGTGFQKVVDCCENRSCSMGKWVQCVRSLHGDEEDRYISWRVLRVCGRKVSSVKQIQEAVGKRKTFKVVFTLPPTTSYGPVTIVGLKKMRHLNGMEGTVVAMREGGALGLVKIQGISAATPISAQALEPCQRPTSGSPNLWQPRPGARVVVTGLKIHSELNDQIGLVSRVRSTDGVVFVSLPEIQNAPLRPVNLRPLEGDEGF